MLSVICYLLCPWIYYEPTWEMQNPIGFQGVSDKCLSVIRESTVHEMFELSWVSEESGQSEMSGMPEMFEIMTI